LFKTKGELILFIGFVLAVAFCATLILMNGQDYTTAAYCRMFAPQIELMKNCSTHPMIIC